MSDMKIRKVKVLDGKLKEMAEEAGFQPNDLVIVQTDPELYMEKVEGDPVSYLIKRARRDQEEAHEIVERMKQTVKEIEDELEKMRKKKRGILRL